MKSTKKLKLILGGICFILLLIMAVNLFKKTLTDQDVPVVELPIEKEEPTSPSQKVMYLTFDDGPSEYTEKIVDILDEHHVPGTFFFIGKNIAGEEDAVEYAARQGHTIGLHSISHHRETIYNENEPLQLLNESLELQATLEPLIGYKTFIIRPPFGSTFMPEVIFNTVGEAGFKFWDWSIDTNDWREETTVDSIMSFLTDFPAGEREILLEHELPITLEVLPLIIKHYQEQGYTFKAYQAADHFPHNFHLNENY